ncbi:MAG: hypothetical protein LKE46_17245 [Clostridium sp.]|uniref:hypothetical protein n=1 Tax=Clostridium sp. TaxID=1506 RepID=UPI0025C107A2|nr:hypothetical protein [Clostridium sp.]MCH3965960.1 hypothetical protein [Clostridium sp.]MCI1871027.1 hypothetical protein [Clostridium sp.]
MSYYGLKIYSKKPLHIHFKCTNCNDIIDIDDSKNIVLFGICSKCREVLKCQGRQNLEE